MRITAAILCALSCASAAHAEVIHFVNPAPGEPGHYDWHWERGMQSWLDITQPATAQPNTPGNSSVGQCDAGIQPFVENYTSEGAAVAIDISPFGDEMTRPLAQGEMFAATAFSEGAYHAIFFSLHEPFGVFSMIPEGEPVYIGVLTGDGRYGWIEVERTEMNLTALAWAYETQPGVPILAGQVPAPGAAALLGVAAALRICRRKRAASGNAVSPR